MDKLVQQYVEGFNSNSARTKLPPVVLEGKEFHHVGCNSTHAFFLAEKDGELFAMSQYDGWDEEKGEGTTEQIVSPVTRDRLAYGEVYLGHY